MLKKCCYSLSLFLLIFNISSCGYKPDAPAIGNNISFPGSLVALNSTHFLMLNTSANGDYRDGSIQQFLVDASGNQSFLNALSVPAHGSEIAVSQDSKLVALSFDDSVNPTQIKFYDYTYPLNPQSANNLTVTLNAAGGKQAVKRLGFFTPTGGGNYYYLYGVIYSSTQDDGSSSNVPNRVFVAKIATNYSSASLLFTLSYGLGDSNSLAAKSDSIVPNNYSFGSSAPTFDATHNLLIAFPTGSLSSGQSTIASPPSPAAFSYFGNQSNANKVVCPTGTLTCAQPDIRVLSLIAVDFTEYLSDSLLNNSTYFAPLAWNGNGIPYGATTTNGTVVNYASSTASGGSSNGDLNSFGFQTNFWSSYWINSSNIGNSGTQCYTTSNATTSSNEYNLNSVGSNGLLVTKYGTNGGGDTGYGNDVLQLTGLDILSNSISTIKTLRGGANAAGESDFKTISLVQTLDTYNTYYTQLQATATPWLNGTTGTTGVSPIVPYIYSKSSSVSSYSGTLTAAYDFGVLNFGSNSCLPYWARGTIGLGSWGMESSWLSTNPNTISAGSNSTYYNAVIDPTQSSSFSFENATGNQFCTNLVPATNTPSVYCANFLNGSLSRFHVSASGVFSKF